MPVLVLVQPGADTDLSLRNENENNNPTKRPSSLVYISGESSKQTSETIRRAKSGPLGRAFTAEPTSDKYLCRFHYAVNFFFAALWMLTHTQFVVVDVAPRDSNSPNPTQSGQKEIY